MTSRVVPVPMAPAEFVTSLDDTVVNVALPTVQRDSALPVTGRQWIATSYISTFCYRRRQHGVTEKSDTRTDDRDRLGESRLAGGSTNRRAGSSTSPAPLY